MTLLHTLDSCLQENPEYFMDGGNPAGRPKDALLSQHWRELFASPHSREEEDTWIETIVRLVLERAVSGDIRACAEVFNRTEGPVRQLIVLD
jgi:hypothetical protein